MGHSPALCAPKTTRATGVVSHWPAYSNWTDEYLCQLAGDTEVTVALTPNGRADAVTPLPPPAGAVAPGGGGGAATGGGVAGGGGGGGAHCPSSHCFALPHQVKMPLRDFLALLHSSKQAGGGGKQGGTADSAADLAARAADAPASAASAASAAAVAPGLANGGGGQGLRLGTAIVPYLQFQNSSLTKEVRFGGAAVGWRCGGVSAALPHAPVLLRSACVHCSQPARHPVCSPFLSPFRPALTTPRAGAGAAGRRGPAAQLGHAGLW